MSKSLGIAALLLSSSAVVATPVPTPGSSIGAVAGEIRGAIADIQEALAEITPGRTNLEEICFRVGNLYRTTRHELEEAAARQQDASGTTKQVVAELIWDGRSLPSFCDDREKVKQDPGYEQVKKGDVVDLKRELRNMDRRAKSLSSP